MYGTHNVANARTQDEVEYALYEDAIWGALALREDRVEHELERLGAWS